MAVLAEYTRFVVDVFFDMLVKIGHVRLLKLAVIVKRNMRLATPKRGR